MIHETTQNQFADYLLIINCHIILSTSIWCLEFYEDLNKRLYQYTVLDNTYNERHFVPPWYH